jgi:hypothetical protein
MMTNLYPWLMTRLKYIHAHTSLGSPNFRSKLLGSAWKYMNPHEVPAPMGYEFSCKIAAPPWSPGPLTSMNFRSKLLGSAWKYMKVPCPMVYEF